MNFVIRQARGVQHTLGGETPAVSYFVSALITMPRIVVALLSLALLSGAVPVHAQSVSGPTAVDSLARVRVVQQSGSPRTTTGQLASADSRRIIIEHAGGRLVVPISEIRRFDVSLGRKIGVLRGASQGFVAGTLLVGIFYLAGDGDGCEDCMITPRKLAIAGGVPFTIFMTGFGALTGMLPGWERWQRAPVPVRIRPASQPSTGGSQQNPEERRDGLLP